MKNLLELWNAAGSLAQNLIGETNPKKIHDALSSEFNSLGLNDADWPAFKLFFTEQSAQLKEQNAANSARAGKPTETEKLRLAEIVKAQAASSAKS